MNLKQLAELLETYAVKQIEAKNEKIARLAYELKNHVENDLEKVSNKPGECSYVY